MDVSYMPLLITAANLCYRYAECLVRARKQHNINRNLRADWRLAQFPRGYRHVAAIKMARG